MAKTKRKRHLKMPGTAFKLWIYCLLEAVPRPDRARELEVGELWLNYEHIRQVIGEAHRQMSKSTVSSALKYLEQSGYLKLQAKSFYGVKACVANWQDYQSGTISVPVESASSTVASTEIVPVEGVSSTPTSTETVPVPVPVRGPEPYDGAASQSPKNIKNKDLKNKDLKNTVVVDLAEHFAGEFGRTLTPFEVSYLTKWRREFPEELILAALARATLRHKRSLAYVGGILTNWQEAGIHTVDEIT